MGSTGVVQAGMGQAFVAWARIRDGRAYSRRLGPGGVASNPDRTGFAGTQSASASVKRLGDSVEFSSARRTADRS